MPEPSRPTPRGIWAILLVLASIQPLVHAIARYMPPEGTVPTGLHIPDSALFLYSMDMFPSGFYSAYATCQSDVGEASFRHYNVPHLWLYGLLGLLARMLPLDPFLLYGLANGAGAFLYLWVVYRLLVVIVPHVANAAFILFALSGGPGGVLYLLAGGAGLLDHPQFELYFFRFGVYDLMEGPHFNPVLYFPRLYYTLSLACCLGGLGAALRTLRGDGTRRPWGWMLAVFAGSVINARVTVFTFGLLVLYVCCDRKIGTQEKLRALLVYGLPGGAGFLVSGALGRLNPAVVDNLLADGAMAMWFSPFLVVTWLHWIAGGRVVTQGARRAPIAVRLLIGSGLGYLGGYAAGYLGYQLYFGNLLAGRDGSVAASVSDGALIGAVAGMLWAWRSRPTAEAATPADATLHWLLLWLIGYTALSLSGFGQGWFLRFGPQRLQIFMWLPLCVVAAMGLATWTARWRRSAYGVLVGCGVVSVAVAAFVFQSPLGRVNAAGPYPTLHTENMREADARLIAALGDGMVLAPAPAGDVVVIRRGNPVVFGIGSFNLTDRRFAVVREAAETFFDPATPDAARRGIAREWCVDWIYCPATWPVDADTREQVEAAPWTEVVLEASGGMILRVIEPAQ